MIIELLYRKDLVKRLISILIFMKKKTLYKNVPDSTNFLFSLCVETGFEIPQNKIVTFETFEKCYRTN